MVQLFLSYLVITCFQAKIDRKTSNECRNKFGTDVKFQASGFVPLAVLNRLTKFDKISSKIRAV